MGVLERFADIIAANINALLDKCEDPVKMIDQYMLKIRKDLAEVKRETAGIIAKEKRAKRHLEDNISDIGKYTVMAKKAIEAGNEEDAKILISKKQELEKLRISLQKSYDIAHVNAEKMRQLHNKLVQDINTLELRRESVKTKVAVAKTQKIINNVELSVSNAGEAQAAFERMELKADEMLDSANAVTELNEGLEDPVVSIEKKYETLGLSSVDEELKKMKEELGK